MIKAFLLVVAQLVDFHVGNPLFALKFAVIDTFELQQFEEFEQIKILDFNFAGDRVLN